MILQVAFNFGDVIKNLQEVGVFDYVLPFLLIFSIIFAILEKSHVLGTNKTNINVVVSAVVGLLVLIQPGIIDTINLFLPRVALIIVVILMGLIVISLLGGQQFPGLSGTTFSVAAILAIIAIILALTLGEGSTGFSISPQDRSALLNIGLPLAIFFGAIALVTRKTPTAVNGVNPRSGLGKLFDEIAQGFGRGRDGNAGGAQP